MAGLLFTAQSPEADTGTAKKTLLQILAPANQGVMVNEISISFQGISNVAAPILVEIQRETTAGTGGTSLTPKKVNSGDGETIQTTALENIVTTQPTAGDIIFSELVHPQGGFNWQAPFGKEIKLPGGTRLGIAVTAGAAVDAVARIGAEE